MGGVCRPVKSFCLPIVGCQAICGTVIHCGHVWGRGSLSARARRLEFQKHS